MRRRCQTYVAGILLASGLATGCSSTWGTRAGLPGFGDQASGATGPSQLIGGSVSGSGLNGASAANDLYGQMPLQPASATGKTGGVVLASLRQAGSSLADALKIESKVTPANDPVKLDNGPSNSNKVAADLHYHAGYFFETQNKFMEAATHYRDALKTQPNDARSIAGYGRVQDQLGNWLEAEQSLRRACDLAPDDPGPSSDLARSYARRRDFANAIAYQERAVKIQPHNQSHRSQLAQYLVSAGRSDDAIKLLIPSHGEQGARTEVAQIANGVQYAATMAAHSGRQGNFGAASGATIERVAHGFSPFLSDHGAACSCSHHGSAGITRLPAVP